VSENQTASTLLTRKEAAEYLRLAPSSLNSQTGKRLGIPFIKMGGAVRYDKRDLDDFINAHRQSSQ
jgi:hypothetical protein